MPNHSETEPRKNTGRAIRRQLMGISMSVCVIVVPSPLFFKLEYQITISNFRAEQVERSFGSHEVGG